MGVLRIEPKVQPLQFVRIQRPMGLPKPTAQLEITINQARVHVPDGVKPETLRLVIELLRQS